MTVRLPLPGHESIGDLRIADLVAKTAKTTIKDAIRVLIAAHTICAYFDVSLADIVGYDYDFDTSRPDPKNVAACEQAYAILEQWTSKLEHPLDGGLGRLLRYR